MSVGSFGFGPHGSGVEGALAPRGGGPEGGGEAPGFGSCKDSEYCNKRKGKLSTKRQVPTSSSSSKDLKFPGLVRPWYHLARRAQLRHLSVLTTSSVREKVNNSLPLSTVRDCLCQKMAFLKTLKMRHEFIFDAFDKHLISQKKTVYANLTN